MLYGDCRTIGTMEIFAVGTTYMRPGYARDDLTGRWLRSGWYVDLCGIGLYGPWETEQEAHDKAGFIRRIAG